MKLWTLGGLCLLVLFGILTPYIAAASSIPSGPFAPVAGPPSAPAPQTATNFISAPNRVDMVHDPNRNLLYITSADSVLRYDLTAQQFLAPYVTGGNLKAIDLSPDGSTLAVADDSYANGQNWIHLINLQTQAIQKATFPLSFGEGGTWSVAYGNDGTLLITSRYNGSGSVPLRRFDPMTGLVATLASITQNTMLNASADGSIIGFAEGNISDGRWGRYRTSDKTLVRRTGYTNGTSASNYEIGTSRDGSQFAIPTFRGAYVYDSNYVRIATVGVQSGPQPVGVVYDPVRDVVYFAWRSTTEVRSFNTTTLTQVGAFDFQDTFNPSGNNAFLQGRLRISRDGSLLFATVSGGVRYVELGSPGPTPTYAPSATPSNTPTVTPTFTATNTRTNTPSRTNTYTPTNTPLVTDTPTRTPTATNTPTPSNTPTRTSTPRGPIAWYVTNRGTDDNDCMTVNTPCWSVNGALGKPGLQTGDTVKVAVGTYWGSGANVVLLNKNVILSGGWNESFNQQIGFSTLDGQNARRGLAIPQGVTATVDHFIMENGYASLGGGLHSSSATVTLNSSLVRNNVATSSGGGISSYGTMTINDSLITHNTSGQVGISGGGGGGGVQVGSGSVTLNRTTISENTLLGNFQGSGILVLGGSLVATNSTIANNHGAQSDGGISSTVANITLKNVTVSSNDKSGVVLVGGSFIVQNSVLANHSEFDCKRNTNYNFSFTNLGYNLVEKQSACVFGETDLVNVDPSLGPLQNNGGSTLTQALLPGSPARDAGDPNTCPATDQRGVSRPRDGNGDGVARCDIGAFEADPPPTPTPTNTATRTSTATRTRTLTATATRTRTPTATLTRTNTPLPTRTFTVTATRSRTPTATLTRTNTPLPTRTFTATVTRTRTPTVTLTRTNTPLPTRTFTATATRTNTPLPTRTFTATATRSRTPTVTLTRTNTPLPTRTFTATATRSRTPTVALTRTNTPLPTRTFTATATRTRTAAPTRTFTPGPTRTFTPTATRTRTSTPAAIVTVAGCSATDRAVLVSPVNGKERTGGSLTLKWKKNPCASNFRLQVRQDAKKSPNMIKKRVDKNKLKLELEPNHTYFWRVRVCDINACGKWSEWSDFRINP